MKPDTKELIRGIFGEIGDYLKIIGISACTPIPVLGEVVALKAFDNSIEANICAPFLLVGIIPRIALFDPIVQQDPRALYVFVPWYVIQTTIVALHNMITIEDICNK